MVQWWFYQTLWNESRCTEDSEQTNPAERDVEVTSNDERYVSRGLPAGVEEPIRGGYDFEESSIHERFETILVSDLKSGTSNCSLPESSSSQSSLQRKNVITKAEILDRMSRYDRNRGLDVIR